jgi:hypothetical protein
MASLSQTLCRPPDTSPRSETHASTSLALVPGCQRCHPAPGWLSLPRRTEEVLTTA